MLGNAPVLELGRDDGPLAVLGALVPFEILIAVGAVVGLLAGIGLAMVLIMIWKPRGLISTREPSAVLKERKTVSAAFVEEGRG